jgi:ABC-2 type transport system permease protein
MIRQIRIELRKLTSTRLAVSLLATAAALTAIFAALEASQAGKTGTYAPAPLYTASGFGAVFSGGVWALMFAAVLGVTIVTTEFRHGTMSLSYLATPGRSRVLTAKVVAGTVAGAVFGLAGFLIAGGTAFGFALGHGYHVPLGDATMARYGVGHLVGGALLGAIGVGIGALIRSQIAGVIAVFVWAVILESLLGGLFTAIRPYLPYTAATNLAGTPLGGAAFGPAHSVSGTGGPLPFAATVALLAAMAIALAVAAARTTIRRDVA